MASKNVMQTMVIWNVACRQDKYGHQTRGQLQQIESGKQKQEVFSISRVASSLNTHGLTSHPSAALRAWRPL